MFLNERADMTEEQVEFNAFLYPQQAGGFNLMVFLGPFSDVLYAEQGP